jgi:hypothetical protein
MARHKLEEELRTELGKSLAEILHSGELCYLGNRFSPCNLRECCLSELEIKKLRLNMLTINTSQLSRAEEHIELINSI